MVSYVYACRSCNDRFELRQKMTDPPLALCPRCGGAVHRVPQATGIIFRGSGFYSTDYKKNSHLPAVPNKDVAGVFADSDTTLRSAREGDLFGRR